MSNTTPATKYFRTVSLAGNAMIGWFTAEQLWKFMARGYTVTAR